jgi:glycosyltransferase involved in cell wall biosynthesis
MNSVRHRRRVLVVAGWYPSPADPVGGIFVRRQVEMLSADHDVAVIAPVLARVGGPGPPPEPSVEYGALTWRPHVRVVFPRRITWAPTAYLYRRALETTYEEVMRTWGVPDLIHAHVSLPAGWGAVALGRSRRIPVVLTEHTGPFSANLHSRSARSLTREAITGASRVVAVSPGLRDDILRFEPDLDVVVVGNVVDTEFFLPPAMPRSSTPPTRLLFVGSLTKVKGPDLLIEALGMVKASTDEPFTLTVVGSGPMRRDLMQQVSALGLDVVVDFTGMLDQVGLRSAMWNAHALISSSHDETFGLAMAEALATELPVIATRTGGARFVLSGGGGLMVDVNAESLAEGIRHLLVERGNLASTASRRSIIDRFSPQVVATSLSALYDSVCSWMAPVRSEDVA